MNLSDLIEAVAVAGEQAMEATRRAYAANIEALHQADPPKIPGSPPLATVVSLDTLGPKRLRLRTHVELGESDGEVTASLVAQADHWWNRTPRNVSTLEIEWDRQDAPEGACRIRDKQNLALDDSLREMENKQNG